MSQSIEKLKEKLQKEFPGKYTVLNEKTMKRIKKLNLPKDDEDELIRDMALLDFNGVLEPDKWLDEVESKMSH